MNETQERKENRIYEEIESFSKLLSTWYRVLDDIEVEDYRKREAFRIGTKAARQLTEGDLWLMIIKSQKEHNNKKVDITPDAVSTENDSSTEEDKKLIMRELTGSELTAGPPKFDETLSDKIIEVYNILTKNEVEPVLVYWGLKDWGLKEQELFKVIIQKVLNPDSYCKIYTRTFGDNSKRYFKVIFSEIERAEEYSEVLINHKKGEGDTEKMYTCSSAEEQDDDDCSLSSTTEDEDYDNLSTVVKEDRLNLRRKRKARIREQIQLQTRRKLTQKESIVSCKMLNKNVGC
jgi:hypothetical protein